MNRAQENGALAGAVTELRTPIESWHGVRVGLTPSRPRSREDRSGLRMAVEPICVIICDIPRRFQDSPQTLIFGRVPLCHWPVAGTPRQPDA